MAGRESKTITAGRAEKIYTNTSTSPVVVAINAVSADNTKNPVCSIVLDTNSTRALNNVIQKYALSQTVSYTASNFDLLDSSGTGVGSYNLSQNTGAGAKVGINGSYGGDVAGSRFWNVDPYYLENPKAYGKDLGKACGSIMPSGNDWRFMSDLNADRSFFNGWLAGTWDGSGSTYINAAGVSYYSVGSVVDFYSDTLLSLNGQGYMAYIEPYNFTGTSVAFRNGSRTSDAFHYQWASQTNPNSYRSGDNLILDWQADGGVFINGMHHTKQMTGTTQHSGNLGLQWAGYHRNDGNDPDGDFKNAEDSQSGNAPNDLPYYNQLYHERWSMQQNGLLSWMKYNPTNKTHYLNVQNRTGGDSGIWSFKAPEAFTANWNSRNFTERCTKETSSFDLTTLTTQPHRIGASLWVCYKGSSQSDALYSTDLINWKTAAQHTGHSTAVLVEANALGADFFLKSTDQNKLFGVDSGFSAIPQDGILENGTAMGVFERNGLVLNTGDSIYMENKDPLTSVHTTVMFVEV